MQQEIQELVEAVQNLKQESSFFKDYMFPIVSAFLSAILGGGVAFWTFRAQESLQIEKEKIVNANKWILSMQRSFNNLVAIKGNYHGRLTSDPLQRIFNIPSVLSEAQPINEDLSSLSFIAPKDLPSESDIKKWEQLPLIGTLADNYNQLLIIWDKQLELDRGVKDKLAEKFRDKASPILDTATIIETVGMSSLVPLLDLTERAIILTDDLILEMAEFLTEFPSVAKSNINVRQLRGYGAVLSFSVEHNEKLKGLMSRSLEVDYQALSSLLNEDIETIKMRFNTGY